MGIGVPISVTREYLGNRKSIDRKQQYLDE